MVITRAPDCAVAYLNLADAEYALGDKAAAAGPLPAVRRIDEGGRQEAEDHGSGTDRAHE